MDHESSTLKCPLLSKGLSLSYKNMFAGLNPNQINEMAENGVDSEGTQKRTGAKDKQNGNFTGWQTTL